jgi:benzoyl-CoA reductase subunit D
MSPGGPPRTDANLLAAGIDVGSSTVKAAIVEDLPGAPRLLATSIERIRKRDSAMVADAVLEEALGRAGVHRGDLAYLATTGEGEVVAARTGHFYGMTTHARGALFLEPRARAVLDAGAFHGRALVMDDRAKVLGYRMTSQCASGSGQFLENICRFLGVALEEIGPLSLASKMPEKCSSICAVLAETDVINMVSRGVAPSDILKGIHDSMAGRYAKLLVAAGAKGVVLMTGGLAQNVGIVASLREAAAEAKAEVDIVAHPLSPLAGAIGAALWGAFRARRMAGAEAGARVS